MGAATRLEEIPCLLLAHLRHHPGRAGTVYRELKDLEAAPHRGGRQRDLLPLPLPRGPAEGQDRQQPGVPDAVHAALELLIFALNFEYGLRAQ
eukprot:7000199-Lingulodinium_polyedra.AAC.1